jgi:hypothetical protein
MRSAIAIEAMVARTINAQIAISRRSVIVRQL